MRHKALPSKDILNKYLDYDLKTGEVRWKITRGPNAKGKLISFVSTSGYLQVRINRSLFYLHRIIWMWKTGDDPADLEIDHINGIKTDNRWCNLRLATHAGNNQNVKLQKNNKSGYKGVCWHKWYQKWHAQISHNYKNINLGFFDDPSEAAEIVKRYRENLHKEFHNHG